MMVYSNEIRGQVVMAPSHNRFTMTVQKRITAAMVTAMSHCMTGL